MAKERLTGKGEPTENVLAGGPTEERLHDNQLKDHWVLPKEERDKGFVRPVRRAYAHKTCGAITTMPQAIAETYARDPTFYGSTFCTRCREYYPVSEFIWDDGSGEKVGS